jgi:hypothetical protein
MIQLSATRCSCIAILWVSLVNSAAITFCVASQLVFVVYFVRLSPETFGYTLINCCLPCYTISQNALLLHPYTKHFLRNFFSYTCGLCSTLKVRNHLPIRTKQLKNPIIFNLNSYSLSLYIFSYSLNFEERERQIHARRWNPLLTVQISGLSSRENPSRPQFQTTKYSVSGRN